MSVLFFLNGLAFFALGMAVALEVRSADRLPMSRSLWLLAAYGFVASLGSWLQMFFVTEHQGPHPAGHSSAHDVLKLLLFVLAASLLLHFSVRVIVTRDAWRAWLRLAPWLLTGVYAALLLVVVLRSGASGDGWISSAEVWARYLLYFPALALASFAFLRRRQEWSRLGLEGVARDCAGAGISFGLKAVVSGLAAVPVLGLASPVTYTWALLLQIARAVMTVAIAFFVVRMLRAFEIQRRRRLDQAVAERLDAQEQALDAQRQACRDIKEWSASMASTVHAISSAINRPTPFAETVQMVLEDTIRLASLQSGAVFLVDGGEPVLHLAAHLGLPDEVVSEISEVTVGDGLAGWVARHGELLIIDDPAALPQKFATGKLRPGSFHVGIPLEAGGKLVGVMHLSSQEPQELTEQQIALLDATGHQLGTAFADAQRTCQVRSMAALEERLRLSRELHDSLVQVLGYLHIKSKVAQTVLASGGPARVQRELEEIETVTARAYDEVRDSILGLRVKLPVEQDFLPVLRAYCAEFSERHDIEVGIDLHQWQHATLSSEARVQVFRIVQEALTNAWKHGQPQHVWIALQRSGDMAHIRIRDDGHGFDPVWLGAGGRQGLGMQTMVERATSVGGSLVVESGPGRGTEIVLQVPIEP